MNAQTKPLFKERHSLEERKKLFQERQLLHPLKVLIILEHLFDQSSNSQLCAADPDQLMVNFQAEITNLLKKKMHSNKHISLFFFINNILPQKDQTMGQLYNKLQDQEDGFLYIYVKSLETLGTF